jgi:hypothetical protein
MRDTRATANTERIERSGQSIAKSRIQAGGDAISHSRALELIAAQFGFNDWNTLHAAAGKPCGPGAA